MSPAIMPVGCLGGYLVWCLFLFQVFGPMGELMGRGTAADLVSCIVKGRFLSRGKLGQLQVCFV